jgi:hypothetical protein
MQHSCLPALSPLLRPPLNLPSTSHPPSPAPRLRDYHQRYKICEYHLKVPSVVRNNRQQRFCQQCGRFHPLEEFDGTKRSCRSRLLKHNARRRKREGGAPAPDEARRRRVGGGAGSDGSDDEGGSGGGARRGGGGGRAGGAWGLDMLAAAADEGSQDGPSRGSPFPGASSAAPAPDAAALAAALAGAAAPGGALQAVLCTLLAQQPVAAGAAGLPLLTLAQAQGAGAALAGLLPLAPAPAMLVAAEDKGTPPPTAGACHAHGGSPGLKHRGTAAVAAAERSPTSSGVSEKARL